MAGKIKEVVCPINGGEMFGVLGDLNRKIATVATMGDGNHIRPVLIYALKSPRLTLLSTPQIEESGVGLITLRAATIPMAKMLTNMTAAAISVFSKRIRPRIISMSTSGINATRDSGSENARRKKRAVTIKQIIPRFTIIQ